MKQQFVITSPYTVLQEMEKPWQLLKRPTLKHVMILQKYKQKKIFFVDTAFWQKLHF
jgi:hypothetical protein